MWRLDRKVRVFLETARARLHRLPGNLIPLTKILEDGSLRGHIAVIQIAAAARKWWRRCCKFLGCEAEFRCCPIVYLLVLQEKKVDAAGWIPSLK